MWTTQDNTIYAFSVAAAHMFRTSKRTVILASAIAYFSSGVKPINGIIVAALTYWLFSLPTRTAFIPSNSKTSRN